MTARDDALTLLAACTDRSKRAAAASSDELKVTAVLRDRVLTEHDLQAALVHALLDVADAIRGTP